MSSNGNGLHLTGTGAAYLRVSTNRQDTERQIESVRSFEQRHNVKIAERFWFEDAGWERDADKERPEFNKLLGMAGRGAVKWIVVDRLDRFGTKSAKRLFRYLGELEDSGCRLYDAGDKEWTGEDDATEITAWLAGSTSSREQREKSYRVLSGMIEKARAGEWQGGPPKLGFDVACFDRATNQELWRVVFEGRDVVGSKMRRGKPRPDYAIRRLKVYADGRSERFDGNVIFRTSKDTQIMRIVPTQDRAKLDAAKAVFERFATESVTYFELAKWLNASGIRNAFGKCFQSRDISKMLLDESYLGYATFSKRRSGRFHRYAAAGILELEPALNGKDTENDPADIIRSGQIFPPLVNRKTWVAVQHKIRSRDKTSHAPKKPELYLAGLVVCAECGAPMIARTDRLEYYCGTWDKHRVRGRIAESPCLRNGVKQDVLEGFVTRYLAETGRRLELLTEGMNAVHLTNRPETDRLESQETEHWQAFRDGIARLTGYLAEHHPAEYDAILRESAREHEFNESTVRESASSNGKRRRLADVPGIQEACERAAKGDNPPVGINDFVDACLKCYRANFDPSGLKAEVEQLESEHTALMRQWADLPTPRAKDKAKERFAELETRIEELRRQQVDAAEVVSTHYREMNDLQMAIVEANRAMRSEAGDHALRQRAEALRGILCRIECEFVATGKLTVGPGNARSKLTAVTFLPIAGDSVKMNGGLSSYAKP